MCDHCGCRAFPAIAELSAEHEVLLELAWQVAEATPDSAAAGSARARLGPLLARHVEVEEGALYPLLEASGDLSPDACAALEDEHRDLHVVLHQGCFDRRSFYALAAHIEHEEMELFPAAMFAFDDDEWETLASSRGERRTDTDHADFDG